MLDREADVAERAEAVVVRGGAVVPDDNPPLRPPPLEPLRVDGVRDDVDAVDGAGILDRVEDPVDHRPPADRQQRLGRLLGERPQPHRITGGEQERLHAATTAPASDSTYGGRWTPCSVTIAVINPAGVTSNAGFRAGKRAVTSAGSRSSIGISRAASDRVIDRRARRDDVERDPVVGGEHGEAVGADLVRGVAVRGDPVGAGEDDVDLAGRHPRGGGRVGDDGVRDAGGLELPSRQARPLEQRAGLVDPDMRSASSRSQAAISAPTALP